MAMNLTNLFTALGRVGKELLLVDTAQAGLQAPFTSLTGYSSVNPAWIASLTSSYDAASRMSSNSMEPWVVAATNILQGFVLADNPGYGGTVDAALEYVREQFVSQSASVAECTISATVTADTLNDGTPLVVCNVVRGDGVRLQNLVPELTTLIVTNDSYTGTATRGQENWQWVGAPNISSRGTGVAVGVYDFDWPQGSGASVAGNFVSAAQDASSGGNLLTNGDFETWTGSAPAVLDNWYLQTGTWGTSIQRSGATDGIDGGYCVQFNTGATLNTLEQQFDSAETDGTQSDAGTSAACPNYSALNVALWTKASGVISGGVLTVSLVDGSGTVIADQAGTNNTATLALTGLSTSWVGRSFPFRLPVKLPTSGVKLRIGITTALAGANLLMDYVAAAVPTALYTGGASIVAFSNPSDPVVAAPDPDAWSVTLANNFAGASYGATFQLLIYRLFQNATTILPYSGSPTIADSLISS